VVQLVQEALGRRVGRETTEESAVQRDLGFLVTLQIAPFFPPALPVAPPYAVCSDRTVMDEDVLRVVDDFDIVVDGVGNRRSGLLGDAQMRFFRRPLLLDRVETTVNTGWPPSTPVSRNSAPIARRCGFTAWWVRS
jgi:hypothetical protein